MQDDNTIEARLRRGAPKLTDELRNRMWSAIEPHTMPRSSVPSPYYPRLLIINNYKPMAAFLVALLIVLGGGGTALASDSARPGDLLFPLDRAIEGARLSLSTTDAARSEYVKQLSEERLAELRSIIDEELATSVSSNTVTALDVSASSSTSTLQIEADVFTDMTVVKLELNDQKQYFTVEAKTRDAVITAIVERYPSLTRALVEERLVFEVEDRASRPKDRGSLLESNTSETRVATAVDAVLRYMDKTGLSDEDQAFLLGALVSEVNGVTKVSRDGNTVRFGNDDARVLFKSQEDGDSRIEIRDGEYRVRIEEKDGEIRIKSRSSDDSDDRDDNSEDSRGRDDSDDQSGRDDDDHRGGDDSNDDDSDNHRSNDDDDRRSSSSSSNSSTTSRSSSSLQVEADVFTDLTTVKVEVNDRTSVFTTSARTRDAVALEVATRFSIPLATVLSILDFELEDRASRPDDSTDESGRGSDDSDDRDDSDDDTNSSGKDSEDSHDDSSGKDDSDDDDGDDSSGKGGR